MVFYHVSADNQRPLMNAPWLVVTGRTKPTGQATGWKLNLFQKDAMEINAFPQLCCKTVTLLYEMQRHLLIVRNQPELSVVKICSYSGKSSL